MAEDAEQDRELPGRLLRYAEALASSPHNLVSRSARAELSSRHLPESVAFAYTLPPGPAKLIDIGSGGGLPGLVIAMVRRDLTVALVESRQKKADFLRDTARSLDVDVAVHQVRAEELARGSLAGTFDLATARAVAPLQRLVPWALPLLRPGGALHAIKGAGWRDELEEAAMTLERLGAEVRAVPDDRAGWEPVDPACPRVIIIGRGPVPEAESGPVG